MAIDLAISVDLKRFLEVSMSLCFVIEERLVVLEPSADLQVDAGLRKRYYGGVIGCFLAGLMNLFLGDYICQSIYKASERDILIDGSRYPQKNDH